MEHKKSLREELIASFIHLITKQTGIIIKEQNRNSLWEKICLRMKAAKAKSLEDYYQILASDTLESYQEWEKLIVLFTNNESYFFRDKEQLKLLKNQILPDLIKQKQTQKSLRICSAGCSTGQEPYTLAILLKELLPDFQQWNVLILGIDIDFQALEEAEKGIYDPWSFRGVDEKIKERYFQKINNQYHLISEIKKLVKFQRVNLVKDLFPRNQTELREMDLILCRNVFIYFENSAIAHILDKIYNTLQPLGYFLTGHTELSGQKLNQFSKIAHAESIVYQRLSEKQIQLEKAQIPKNIKPQETIINYQQTFQTEQTKKSKDLFKKVKNITINKNDNYKPQIPVSPQPSIKILFVEVENLLAQEAYDLALKKLEEIIQIDLNNFKAYYLLAQVQANIGQYELAIKSCQQALKIDAFNLSIYYLLAQIAEEQGNLTEAKRILKQIIYLDADSVNAYLELSQIYKKEGDLKRSQKMKESALNLLEE